MSELQGGAKVRVLLARALFRNFRPTFAARRPTIIWTGFQCNLVLQDLLKAYEGVLIGFSSRPPF